MLKDSFGRVHDYLRISLTDRCNLKCSYCMPEKPCYLPSTSLLTDEEILEIARIFVVHFQVRKIRFTGGEPLLRKNLLKIIGPLSRLPVKLAMTTNGILLDRYLVALKDTGIKSLNVSLDSLKPDRFHRITGSNTLRQIQQNIQNAIEAGFQLKINIVLKAGMNEDEILDFVDWTREENIHIRFIEFMPFSGNSWEWEKVIPFSEIIHKIERVYSVEKIIDEEHSTAKAYRVCGFKGSFAVISSITTSFCATCNRIRLTADGKLKNCLFSQQEFDLRIPLRKGSDIRPIIIEAISAKHAERGGQNQFFEAGADNVFQRGRSMRSIGG